jgi:hypothetical protein
VVANVDHLHVNRIHLEPLVDHFYIVRDDYTQFLKPIIELIAMKSKETYCTKNQKKQISLIQLEKEFSTLLYAHTISSFININIC